MKVRRSIVAVAAAVVLGATGALVLPAAASAHDASHTLKFTSVPVKSVRFTRTTFAFQETDHNSAGKTIGFDDVHYTVTGKNTARARVAYDVRGGFIYTRVSTTNGGQRFSGKVTGGTGAFKGATGTITIKIANNKGAVTIIYS